MNSAFLAGIRELVQGKRVVEVAPGGDVLKLDDGTVLRLYESESDCCASARGSWVIQPDALDAMITNVEFQQHKDAEDDEYHDGHESTATITILHNQNPLALGDCYANDGNGGYYYSALSLEIVVPGQETFAVKVIEA